MAQGFDELFWNRFDTLNKDTDLAYNFGSESYNEGYKAGAASRQAEMDELKVMIRKLVDNTIIGFDDELENQANDLLKGKSK